MPPDLTGGGGRMTSLASSGCWFSSAFCRNPAGQARTRRLSPGGPGHLWRKSTTATGGKPTRASLVDSPFGWPGSSLLGRVMRKWASLAGWVSSVLKAWHWTRLNIESLKHTDQDMDGTHVMQQHMTESSHWTRERCGYFTVNRTEEPVDFPTFVFFYFNKFFVVFLFKEYFSRKKRQKILTRKILEKNLRWRIKKIGEQKIFWKKN